MLCTRRDMKPLTGTERNHFSFKLHGRCTGKHIEELTSTRMKMTSLASTWRNSLLNHAKRRIFKQVPAVANSAPCVIFGSSDV